MDRMILFIVKWGFIVRITKQELEQIIKEELDAVLYEKCQKGYKTHEKRKTKKMFGKTYRNCV